MKMITLTTKRLELIPVTVELCYADLYSRKRFSSVLHARVPESWPPALLAPETLKEFIELLLVEGGSRLFAYYWVRTGIMQDDRILIGGGGFVLGEDDVPELGYSVLDEFQRQGYATEAVNVMISQIRKKPDVTSIKACTFPSLIGSIRVLEKSGFILTGNGPEEDSIAYWLNF